MLKEHIFCDRCGKEIKSKSWNNRGFHLYPRSILRSVHGAECYYDLCQDCYDSLERWFKAGKNENKDTKEDKE